MAYKIIFFPFSGVGHLNPMIKIINELIKSYEAKVIVYSIRDFKSAIEGVDAEWRILEDISYENDIGGKSKPDDRYIPMFTNLYSGMYSIIDKHTLKIIEVLETEKPDVVLYDSFYIPAKCALEIFNRKQSTPLKSIAYWTTFIYEQGILPNDDSERRDKLVLTADESTELDELLKSTNENFQKLYTRLELGTFHGTKRLFSIDRSVLNIILTFPELQPNVHLYQHENIKYAGACITDGVHFGGANQLDKLEEKSILEEFPVINPNYKYNRDENGDSTKVKLVYVSFGTVFNKNIQLYEMVIDAFKILNEGSPHGLKIIISLGQTLFNHFNSEISNNRLSIPHNIRIGPSFNQLEILKRASLVVTHCGMNSTSECVHYGIPMICIPINADQPGNAYHVATKLCLGIELRFRTVTSIQIKDAIHSIFADASYRERCNRYAELSGRYVGQKNAANIIISNIKENSVHF